MKQPRTVSSTLTADEAAAAVAAVRTARNLATAAAERYHDAAVKAHIAATTATARADEALAAVEALDRDLAAARHAQLSAAR